MTKLRLSEGNSQKKPTFGLRHIRAILVLRGILFSAQKAIKQN
jgi:hypothetical protein